MSLWIDEHGADYDIPSALLGLEGLLDMSWHNDTAPRFGVTFDEHHELTLNIWVEHPDPERREDFDLARFTVIANGHFDWAESVLDIAGVLNEDVLISTDDVQEAINTFLTTPPLIQIVAIKTKKAA